ncbi:MAG: right-handed parallel beta-helix repeat-containing protein [Gaiellaceae bacterium]
MARRERLDALIRPFGGLNTAFFAVLAVMAAHESEHVAQVVQKDGTLERCPEDCRGLLGFIFDIEWVHFAYNSTILVALVLLFMAYRMWEPRWRRAALAPWLALTGGIFVVQLYHVVEHSAKLQQWLTNGHVSPTPGLLGKELEPAHGHNFSLVELHFVFNTIVFVLVGAAYFGFGFHRHVPGRVRVPAWAPALVVAVPLLGASALAWVTQTPTMRLAAGEHQGPLVINSATKVVGDDGAVVRGGIVITADGVTVQNVTVVGGEHGIAIDGARGVVLDGVHVRGATLDGINVRRGNARIRDCVIESRGEYVQGIDVSFTMDKPPTLIQGCRIRGGQEAIATHWAKVMVQRNRVSGTSLRGITVTEMSMGKVNGNHVEGALGIGIFCGDYSHCEIAGNRVTGTRPDMASGDLLRDGVGIMAHFGAVAELGDNELDGNGRRVATYAQGRFERAD